MNKVCSMDCFNCFFEDCVLSDDCISTSERKFSNSLDTTAIQLRGLEYDTTRHLRQLKDVDPLLYSQAQRRYFHRKYYYRDVEKSRREGRESYARHRESRLSSFKTYYESHKDEISAQKKSYYYENREAILAKRKESYVPHPREVLDTTSAEKSRSSSKRYYEKHREEINRKRREKYRKEKELCCQS